jgi:GH15 family glucan-1,4-alpha-glucosidase
MNVVKSKPRTLAGIVVFCILGCAALLPAQERNLCDASGNTELSRVAQNWQFLDAVGRHAGIFGREDGTLEGWIFPLKLFRDFHLIFRVGNHTIAAEALPRTIITRPESTSIRYQSDAFSVCETLFVPVDQRGAIITLQAEIAQPLSKKEIQGEMAGTLAIEAEFSPDVVWMWPAGMGDAYSTWDTEARLYRFGEEQHRFYAVAGGPGVSPVAQTYSNNYTASQTDSFIFPPLAAGKASYTFAMAASFESQKDAENTYQQLLANGPQLLQQASDYYRQYLDKSVSLTLPDRDLQTAYDWARIATILGAVDEPFAGSGLIAGYDVSGFNRRPGFGWFFGRDSMWTSLALNSAGDFAMTKAALQFLSTYQRPNGKIPHEIPQTVKLVDWWNKYVYGTASADATALYIIGMDDYVKYSGDVAFAREKWDSVWKAYQFLRSTYAPNGLPLNKGVGHGWIEGGALLPVSTELYQAGVGLAALRALADLAPLAGKSDVVSALKAEADSQQAKIEILFWSPANNIYGYALDANGVLIDKPSVLGTVPMWFGLLNQQHAEQFLDVLAAPDEQADWGMRIISEKDPLYYPVGYHFGSVWPLFTGWASVAEYRYHRPLPAYLNLRANAQLIFDGALGRATEVLSGHYYAPLNTSSSHQIWSSAMIISPILRGMMGLSVDAPRHLVTFAPHVPGGWKTFAIRNVKVGNSTLKFDYQKTADSLTLSVDCQGSDRVELEFSPAFSPRAQLLEASVNQASSAIKLSGDSKGNDQHPVQRVSLAPGKTTITIHFRNDFGIDYPYTPPQPGAVSRALKFVSESWNTTGDRLELELAGSAGLSYEVPLAGDLQGVTVNGGSLEQRENQAILRIAFPPGEADAFRTQKVTLQFLR